MKTRRLTSRLPSLGFVLVMASLAIVVAFVAWIAGEDWYDRLGRPMDRETRRETLAKYSDYLEAIAPRLRTKENGIETVRRAIGLRKQLGDEAGERRAIAILEDLTGEQAFDVRTSGVTAEGWTDGQRSQIAIANQSASPLHRVLRFGYSEWNEKMPITVEVRRGHERSRTVFAEPIFENLQLDIPPGETAEVVVTTDKLFRLPGTQRDVGVQVQIVESIETIALQTTGIAGDGWTLNGQPATVRITNPGTEPLAKYLELAFYHSTPNMATPVKVVNVGDDRQLTFVGPGFDTVHFTIPANGHRTIRVIAGAWFNPPSDQRSLGVHAEVVTSLPGVDLDVEGITQDGWTLGQEPGTFRFSNSTATAATVVFKVGYYFAHDAMPVTVQVGEPDDTATYLFTGQGTRRYFFTVAPMRTATLRVECADTFSPANDARNLGVHVQVIDADDADPITIEGIHKDGWITDAGAGRISIRNATQMPIQRRLILKHFVDNDQMPITVFVTEVPTGETREFVFERAGSQEFELLVEPGRERTWEITTDKYFTTPRDRRRLGVNVEILE